MGTFAQELGAIAARISQPDFLNNKGLGNEVGIHVFCYQPAQELQVRTHVARLKARSEKGELPCNIIHHDLWDVLLAICERKNILDRISSLEERRGSEQLKKRLASVATPEAFIREMDWEPHAPGADVLFITGVGKVYPFMRAHSILENGQHAFADVPVVLFYPGTYDGQRLSLFGHVEQANYYRAFNLL